MARGIRARTFKDIAGTPRCWGLRCVDDVLQQPASLGASKLSFAEKVVSLHAIAKRAEHHMCDYVSSHSSPPNTDVLEFTHDLLFKALISRLHACDSDLKFPRVVMRVLWSLGRVGVSLVFAKIR